MVLELEQVKKHLNIDNSYTDDDLYILDLVTVAEDSVKKHLDIKQFDELGAGGIPASVVHAMLLMVGNLYMNREPVASVKYTELPLSYGYLLGLYKRY